MDGPRDGHTKCSKSDRKRQIKGILYMWNLNKIGTNELIYKIESWRQKTNFWLWGGEWWGRRGMNLEVGIDVLHTTVQKMDNG